MWAGGSSMSSTLCRAGPASDESAEPPASVVSVVEVSLLVARASLASVAAAVSPPSRSSPATPGTGVETLVPTGLPAAHAPVKIATPIEIADRITDRETRPRLATQPALWRT